MNTEYFIAKRIIKGEKGYSNRISRPIVKISTLSITLGIIIMIISVSVLTGYQNEIRDKVIGFGSHIQIQSAQENVPLNLAETNYYPSLQDHPEIKHIQKYANISSIIQSRGDTVWNKEKTDYKIERDIYGATCKGVGTDYDWSFFENSLVAGRLPNISDTSKTKDILVSEHIANKLRMEVGEKVDLYFVSNDAAPLKVFKVCGIYKTGLEVFDEQFVFIDINYAQELNEWGLKAKLELLDTCVQSYYALKASVKGGNKNYRYDWGAGFDVSRYKALCPLRDTTIKVIASDIRLEGVYQDSIVTNFIPDTVWLDIKLNIKDSTKNLCNCNLVDDSWDIEYSDETPGKRIYHFDGYDVITQTRNSKSTISNYVSGFEVAVNNWDNIDTLKYLINEETGGALGDFKRKVTSTKESNQQIFGWLELLEINVWIIISLMIMVAVINMSSALLVLILEKTNMIGIFKAMGANNWSIRKVFLYNAAYLIGKGLFWGNLIGIGLCLIQQYFGIVTLNPETYYLSEVPININWWYIIALNIGTIIVCTLMLIIPSYLVTKISPVKAIKFD